MGVVGRSVGMFRGGVDKFRGSVDVGSGGVILVGNGVDVGKSGVGLFGDTLGVVGGGVGYRYMMETEYIYMYLCTVCMFPCSPT